MIVGLGIDLVESSRVGKDLARQHWAADDGVFTPAEIAYCSSGKHPERRYAVCFAAKEAALKALGAEVPDLGVFREVEVKLGSRTRYKIVLHDRLQATARRLGVRHINLSIAVAREHIGAMVILESGTKGRPDRISL